MIIPCEQERFGLADKNRNAMITGNGQSDFEIDFGIRCLEKRSTGAPVLMASTAFIPDALRLPENAVITIKTARTNKETK